MAEFLPFNGLLPVPEKAETVRQSKHHLCLAHRGKEIDITAVPAGIEVIEAAAFRTGGTVESGCIIQRVPIVAVAAAAGKETCTLIVFPGLEIYTQFIVVFAVDFINCDLYPHLRNGYIVLFKQFGNIFR